MFRAQAIKWDGDDIYWELITCQALHVLISSIERKDKKMAWLLNALYLNITSRTRIRMPYIFVMTAWPQYTQTHLEFVKGWSRSWSSFPSQARGCWSLVVNSRHLEGCIGQYGYIIEKLRTINCFMIIKILATLNECLQCVGCYTKHTCAVDVCACVYACLCV